MKDERIRTGRLLFICLSFIVSSFILFPAYAAPQDDLEKTRKAMEQTEARQAELAARKRKIETELRELQQQLVATAQAVQAGESDLSVSEDKLNILSVQLGNKSVALAVHEERLEALIDAALRLSRTPPEAAVMMPGEGPQTLKAARALKMMSESIRQEMASLKLQMSELSQLKDKVAKGRSEYSRKQAGLDRIRQTLKTRLSARKALQARLGREQAAQQEKREALARKAEDLEALVASLGRAEKAGGKKGELRSFVEARGHIRMPAAGKVVRSFGVETGRNETSKGITLDTRGGAQVTAPYDGEVVFTGPFLAYGRMVIIRHSDDFHTLLAGLAKIDTSPGEFLLEGEPIGAMGDKAPANRLYVELRQSNQPVDPLGWIARK